MAGAKRTRAGGSLASQLESLLSPTPAAVGFDPEEAGGFGQEVQHFYDEDDGLDLDATHDSKRSGTLGLKGPLLIEGAEYGGKPSKRSRIFGDRVDGFPEEGEEDDEDEEEGEGEDGEDADEGADNSDGGDPAARLASAFLRAPASDFEREFEEIIKSEQQREQDGEQGQLGDGGAPEGVSEERSQHQQQQQQEGGISWHPAAAQDEAEKARGVAAQVALWERVLEVRILVQRVFSAGGRLPHPGSHAKLSQKPEVAQEFLGFRDQVSSLLGSLLSVSAAVREQNPARGKATTGDDSQKNEGAEHTRRDDVVMNGNGEEPSSSVAAQNPRVLADSDALWEQLSAEYEELKGFSNTSLDRWHRKTLLTTGKLSLSGKGNRLQALNQSISSQVANAMRNPERLIKRARLQVGATNVIGSQATGEGDRARLQVGSANVTGSRSTGEGGRASQQGEDPPLEPSKPEEEGLDMESYDDSEFYQQLLQEFLESSNACEHGGLGASYQSRKTKKRKSGVDRRASKGRKVRYTVMNPLVNFMASEPMRESPIAESLFLNLFGYQ